MKKNMFMRLAMALVLLVLVTTSAVGGTYAKYVTGDDADSEARVAKWGVTVAAKMDDIFEPGYNTADNPTASADVSSVFADGTAQLLAPGTKDEQAAALVLTGTPEVMVEVVYTLDVEFEGWEIDTGEYLPIYVTITNNVPTGSNGITTTVYIGKTETIDQFEARIESLVNQTKVYYPNDDIANTITIGWAWDYNGVDFPENAGYVTDEKDTKLGDLATAPTFYIKLGATVTQQD